MGEVRALVGHREVVHGLVVGRLVGQLIEQVARLGEQIHCLGATFVEHVVIDEEAQRIAQLGHDLVRSRLGHDHLGDGDGRLHVADVGQAVRPSHREVEAIGHRRRAGFGLRVELDRALEVTSRTRP